MSKRHQWILFFLSFLGDFGNSLLLVTSIAYGVTLTEDPLLIGAIGAAYGLTYLVTPAILGRVGDRFPRKTSLLIATSSQTIIAIYFFIVARSPVLLIVGQVLLGIAYGFYWPSVEAYISESSDSDNASNSESFHKKAILSFCIAWSLGYMIGPLLAGVFSDFFLPGAFITVIITYLVAFILILIYLPKIPPNIQNPVIFEKPDKFSLQSRYIRLVELIITVFLYAFISKILYTYFADYALDIEGLYWSDSLMGSVLFLFGLGRTGFFVLNYFWIRIRSTIKLILFTFLGMGVCLMLIPLTSNAILLSILLIGMGIGAGIVYSSSLDLTLYQVRHTKGASAGLFESMVGLGSISAPLSAGLIAKNFHLTTPFYVFGGFTLMIFAVMMILEYLIPILLFRKRTAS